MAGTHRKSSSIDKGPQSPFTITHHRSRAGSMTSRDKAKTNMPNPLAEIGVNSPSPLRRSDALANLTNLNQTAMHSPSTTRMKRLHLPKKQISVDNFMQPSHRESPFGTPRPIVNPSLHPLHPAQRISTREPHPLSQSSILSSSTTPSISTEKARKLKSQNRHHVAALKISTLQQDGANLCTPDALKAVKPRAEVFASTGLLSKRNRPCEHLRLAKPTPDTPCKRPSTLALPQTPSTPGTPLGAKGGFFAPEHDKTSQQNDHVLEDYIAWHRNNDFPFISPSSNLEDMPHTPTRSLFPTSHASTNGSLTRKPMLFENSSVEEDNYLARDISPMAPSSLRSSTSMRQLGSERSDNSQPSFTSLSSDGHLHGSSFSEMIPMYTSPVCFTSMETRFQHIEKIGSGEFSEVFVVDQGPNRVKYAVKRTKTPCTTKKERLRRQEEVNVLQHLGKHEHIIELVDSWTEAEHLFIQTEYCENGSLEVYLRDYGRHQRLDEFRVWKILTELALGVHYIHEKGFLHLDLKPANVLIAFDGVLKIGDFGMSVSWPVHGNIEREGDREYIAPEVLAHGSYDKPVDVFSLGLIIFEVAANIVLPDNGASWQKLRSGDLSDAPRLSSSDPETLPQSVHETLLPHRYIGQGGLDRTVTWMVTPSPNDRPTAQDILNIEEVQWVNRVRRAGAIIHEGDAGPSEHADYDIYMVDEEGHPDAVREDWRMEM